MRKKLKKYNLGGGAPGGSFVSGLLDTLNAVPVNGQTIGDNVFNNLVGNAGENVALSAMNRFANANIPPDLMGQYRRGSMGAAMNQGVSGQFGFMNNFMQQNQLGQFTPPPQVNTDPFQFMPQVGLQNQMDAAGQALELTGPINTEGPQVGMPVNPNVNMSSDPIINPGTVTSGTYGNIAKPLSLTASATPNYTVSNPIMDSSAGSGMGNVGQEESLINSVIGETNEFDKAKSAVNTAKGTVSTLKKIIGEDTFKSHGAKLLSKIPGKVGEKIGEKVAASAAKNAGTKFGSFLGSNAGAAASFGVGLLGKGIQELDKKDGNYSRLGAMGGGALQGAALGSMLGPVGTIAGGLIGAGIGELQRGKFESNARAEELTKKTILAKDNARTRLQSKQILANVPTQGIKDQIYDEGGKTPARQKYIPEGDQMTLDMISQYMTDTRSPADDPYDFSAAMDTIAFHESGMDPQRHQMAGGPGRGIVQYDEPSALAASNRLRDLSKIWGKPNPEWNTPEGTKDFSKLTVEQQKMLWMADKLMDKTVDLAALGMREEPLVDFWADHHWRGKDKDRAKRQLSFESHRLPAKALGLPEYKEEAPQAEPEIPALTPNIEMPYNPLVIGGAPKEYKPDTLKVSFDQGGSTDPTEEKHQGPSISPNDPRFAEIRDRAEAIYDLNHPYADLNLPPSGRTDYVFGPADTVLGFIPFGKLAGTMGKRAALQGLKKYGQGRNVGFPLGKYGRREVVQGLRREGPLFGFEQALGLDLMSSSTAQDYPLKEYKEGPKMEPAPKYNYGGNTDKFDYIAEGGEVIVHKPGDIPDTDQNGYLSPLGPNVKMINGDKHSAPSGGVKMGQDENAFIYSDKLKVSKEMENKIYGSNGKLRF